MSDKVVKSDFYKNVLTLLTGTTIAQALPIAISPILARMYSPEDFGVLALFVAITSIFAVIVNARYELAIVLPEKDEDAINILALGVLISIIFSLIILIVVIIFHNQILILLDNKNISLWLYFIPLVVLLTGLYNVLNFYNTRIKNFKNIAISSIYKSISMVIVQLIVGFFKTGASGLIIGRIVSFFSGNFGMLNVVVSDKILMSKISKSGMKKMANRYIDFPKFSLAGALANSMSIELSNVFMSSLFNISTLGFYSFANNMLKMPGALIGKSISQVYFQEANKERIEKGNAVKTFEGTVKKLFFISFPIFLLLFFFVEDIFAFVFSEKWRVAGQYAQILIPYIFVNFIVSPITITNSVFEKQKVSLIWQLGMLVLTLFVFWLAWTYSFEIKTLLYILTGIFTFYYLVFLLILYRIAKG
ncbi:MAG TPA: hypothetical protein DDX39_05045 [Bacteroidales bacterium]|nr:MAG: hypothetical protein A2W98_00255 [Bacteroidetes bacterium GWF2_33_38]OFY75924.1 MAG: hypothetical protein A2265_08225 [Bacteroidetes bacterium RIFOXYA12_FULL_33_9]OFY91412.1 MAG: hypothetical protein A2236_00415 [Bacteroidetes bacterium RIFOXYA2_FULL_33_7]HBF87992.1 hypothetical protein [Bacteroidales bacterium]